MHFFNQFNFLLLVNDAIYVVFRAMTRALAVIVAFAAGNADYDVADSISRSSPDLGCNSNSWIADSEPRLDFLKPLWTSLRLRSADRVHGSSHVTNLN